MWRYGGTCFVVTITLDANGSVDSGNDFLALNKPQIGLPGLGLDEQLDIFKLAGERVEKEDYTLLMATARGCCRANEFFHLIVVEIVCFPLGNRAFRELSTVLHNGEEGMSSS